MANIHVARTAPAIPVEVIAAVIETLFADVEALKAASLLCRTFRNLAQRLLFTTYSLNIKDNDITVSVLKGLISSTRITSYIKSFQLTSRMDPNQWSIWSSRNDLDELADLLEQIPSLLVRIKAFSMCLGKQLFLTPFVLTRNGGRLLAVARRLCEARTLTTLEISCIPSFIIRSCSPSIKHLLTTAMVPFIVFPSDSHEPSRPPVVLETLRCINFPFINPLVGRDTFLLDPRYFDLRSLKYLDVSCHDIHEFDLVQGALRLCRETLESFAVSYNVTYLSPGLVLEFADVTNLKFLSVCPLDDLPSPSSDATSWVHAQLSSNYMESLEMICIAVDLRMENFEDWRAISETLADKQRFPKLIGVAVRPWPLKTVTQKMVDGAQDNLGSVFSALKDRGVVISLKYWQFK